jgi:hypothetical protein
VKGLRLAQTSSTRLALHCDYLLHSCNPSYSSVIALQYENFGQFKKNASLFVVFRFLRELFTLSTIMGSSPQTM